MASLTNPYSVLDQARICAALCAALTLGCKNEGQSKSQLFDLAPASSSIRVEMIVDDALLSHEAKQGDLSQVKEAFAASLVRDGTMKKREMYGKIEFLGSSEPSWDIFYVDNSTLGVMLPTGETLIGFDRRKVIAWLKSKD